MKHLAITLVCAAFTANFAAAQSDTGVIEGTVTNALNGNPLKKSTVTANLVGSHTGGAASATTRADGHYVLSGLAPGKYVITANHNGFVTHNYGAKAANRPAVRLSVSPGGKVTADMPMLPQGVISGRVVDEDGDPISGASVQILRQAYLRGRKQLMPAQSSMTNDKGEYRMFGLAPGKYFITATHSSVESEQVYGVTYYPNATTSSAAAPLEIAPGSEMQGIDMSLVKSRAFHIRGLIVDADNQPVNGAAVWLAARDTTALSFRRAENLGQMILNGKGGFELRGVTPGSYYLFANFQGRAGKAPIDVGAANLDGVVVQVQPPAETIARIAIEGQTDPLPKSLSVYLQPKDPGVFANQASGRAEDGPIRLHVNPEVYEVNVSGLTNGLYLKSVKFGDTEVTDAGLDFSHGVPPGEISVLLSPAGAQVDGTVQDDKDQPVPNATVVLVPAIEKRSIPRLYRQATTDAAGHFSLKGVAPGDYSLFSWDQVEIGAWQDPDFLKPFESHGESVTLKENSHESKQLKVL